MSIMLKSLIASTENVVGEKLDSFNEEDFVLGLETSELLNEYEKIKIEEGEYLKLNDIKEGLEKIVQVTEQKEYNKINNFLLVEQYKSLTSPFDLKEDINLISLEENGESDAEDETGTKDAIKDKAKNVLTKIKNIKDSVQEKISNWISKVFNQTAKLKEKGNALKQKLSSLPDTPKKNTISFNFGKIVRDFKEIKDIDIVIKNLLLEMDSFVVKKGTLVSVNEMVSTLSSIDVDKDGAEKTYETLAKSADKAIKNIVSLIKTDGDNKYGDLDPDVYDIKKSGLLPYNRALYGVYPKGGFKTNIKEGDINEVGSFFKHFFMSGVEMDVNDAIFEREKSKTAEVIVASKNDLETMLNKYLDLLDSIEEYKNNSENAKDLKKKLIDSYNSVQGKLKGKKLDRVESSIVRNLSQIPRTLTKQINEPANDLINLALRTTSTILNFISKMTKAY